MKTEKRRPMKERNIDAPILALRVDEEMKRLKRESKWKSGREDGITLTKYPHLRIVLVALKKNTDMREHQLRGPLSVYVVSGKVNVTAEKNEYQINKNGLLTLRKAVLHDVRARTDSVILLTLMAL